MAEVITFPQGGIDWTADQVGQALAALVLRDRAGDVRSGVFPGRETLLSGRSDRAVDVAPFLAAFNDSGAVLLGGTDAIEQVTLAAPPVSGGRIDRICWNPVGLPLYVVSGVAAGTPIAPSIPSGMLSIGTVRVTAGDANTNVAIIRDDFPFTAAAGGVLLVRNAPDLDAWDAQEGALARALDTGDAYAVVDGSWELDPGATRTVAMGWDTAKVNIVRSALEVGAGRARLRFHVTKKSGQWASNEILGIIPAEFRPDNPEFSPISVTPVGPVGNVAARPDGNFHIYTTSGTVAMGEAVWDY